MNDNNTEDPRNNVDHNEQTLTNEENNNQADDDQEDWLLHRSQKEWCDFVRFSPSYGVIAMFVIGGVNYNDCNVIHNLNVYVITFACVNLVSGLNKLINRTEKLKRERSSSSPWLWVEAVFAVALLGLSIWGATLTFGNFGKMGKGIDECHPAIFICAFVSSVITLVIFFVIVPIMIYFEVKKEQAAMSKEEEEEEEEARRAAPELELEQV